jgi:AcrR family transcriptional regulator
MTSWSYDCGVPKETWLNLPDAKRERITKAALNEFGARGFSAGSLNVIAREAGIAKGSIFQYFEDKLDLFDTVCEAGSTAIAEATIGAVDTNVPFFDLLHDLVVTWTAYFRARPNDQRWAFAAANEIEPAARRAVRSVANLHYEKAFRPVVEQAIARGELRDDADPDLVISMTVLVLRHLNSAPFDPVGDPAISFVDMTDADVDDLALEYVNLLERAFGPSWVRRGQ